MGQHAIDMSASKPQPAAQPALSGETRRHLGSALRVVYEATLDTQPLPDSQVDLLLRLRHKERDLRRVV